MRKGATWTKRVGITAIVLLALASSGAFLLFGHTTADQVALDVYVLRTGNGLSGVGANVTVFVSAQSKIIVDSQLGALSRRIGRMSASLGDAVTTGLINTHWHPDHTGGNGSLSGDAPVIAHTSVLERLSRPQEGFGLTKPGSHHTFEARAEADLPTHLVDDTATVLHGTGTLQVIHPGPAHTDGDLIVFDPTASVVVAGDLVWPHSFPFIDNHNGGSATGLAVALASLLSWIPNDAVVVPGHGAPMSVAELATYQDMVAATIAEVRASWDEGLSLDEIQSRGLTAAWTDWSSKLVPEREWIAMIHRSLLTP